MATRLKNPSDIAGLLGYLTVTDSSTMTLDGSNGLSQWTSQYGSLTATQTDSTRRPVYNASVASIGSKPALTFTNTQRMDFTTPAAFPTGSAAHTVLLLFRGTVSQGNVCVLSWGGSTGSWRIFGYGNSGTNTWAALANVGDHSSVTSALNATLIEVHTVTAGASPASNHYANGGAANTKSFGGSLTTNNTTATIGYTPYLGLNANGVVLEAIAIYDRVLSTSDRQDLEGIVAWQHGQQALLASGHPSATAAPTIDDGAGGGTTVSGTASMAGAGTMAAAGVTMARASAAMTGTGAMAASGATIAAGVAALSGAGALAAMGGSLVSRAAALAGTSTFAASSMAVAGRIVSFVGSSALTVISRRTASATAAMSGTSTFAAKPPAPPVDPAEEATIGMQLVPVDGKRTDWPRLVANAVNALIKEYRVRVTNPFMQLDTAPFQPTEGQTYYDTTLHQVRVWNGTSWLAL